LGRFNRNANGVRAHTVGVGVKPFSVPRKQQHLRSSPLFRQHTLHFRTAPNEERPAVNRFRAAPKWKKPSFPEEIAVSALQPLKIVLRRKASEWISKPTRSGSFEVALFWHFAPTGQP